MLYSIAFVVTDVYRIASFMVVRATIAVVVAAAMETAGTTGIIVITRENKIE